MSGVAKVEATRYTLARLLDAYCAYLESLDRKSHKDARSIFKLHVIDAWPKVAALPANGVTGEQIADMMRRVIDLGKDRTANKLRSYVSAAYQVAKASRSKASIPVEFKSFNVKSNPASETEPDESATSSDSSAACRTEVKLPKPFWTLNVTPNSSNTGASTPATVDFSLQTSIRVGWSCQ